MQVCSAPEIGWCTNSGSRLQEKKKVCMHAHIASFLGPQPSFSLFSVWGKRSGNEVNKQCCHADTSKFNINYESTMWLTHCVQDSIFLSFLHWHIQREWNQMETNTRHRYSSAGRQKHYEMELCAYNLSYTACLICMEAVKWCVVFLVPQLYCPVCTTT